MSNQVFEEKDAFLRVSKSTTKKDMKLGLFKKGHFSKIFTRDQIFSLLLLL